jgi:uncharacterized OB-fold protein
VSGLRVWRCGRCRHVVFPERELCPRCGGDSLAEETVDEGTATEITSHRDTRIACVEIDGTRILARADEGVRAGSPVSLVADGGVPVARPR